MSLVQMSDYNMGSLTSQLFFWINCLWPLCFVPKGTASAASLSEASAFGVLPQEASKCMTGGKSLLMHCPVCNKAHRAVPLLHLVASCSGWIDGLMSPPWPFEDDHFPCMCKHQKPIPPPRGENESSEDPKEKLPISHLIPTALYSSHLLCMVLRSC